MRRSPAACATSTRTCSEHWVLWARRRWVDAKLVWMGSGEGRAAGRALYAESIRLCSESLGVFGGDAPVMGRNRAAWGWEVAAACAVSTGHAGSTQGSRRAGDGYKPGQDRAGQGWTQGCGLPSCCISTRTCQEWQGAWRARRCVLLRKEVTPNHWSSTQLCAMFTCCCMRADAAGCRVAFQADGGSKRAESTAAALSLCTQLCAHC